MGPIPAYAGMNPSEAQDAARTQSAGDPYEKVRNINLNNVRKIKNGLPPLSSWGLTPGFQVNKKSPPSAHSKLSFLLWAPHNRQILWVGKGRNDNDRVSAIGGHIHCSLRFAL